MLSKMRKMLKKQDGFTLIELMTVLIILGVILGIGVPKYMQVQAKAKYEADVAALQSLARTAETYAVTWSDDLEYNGTPKIATVKVSALVDKKLIDPADFILNGLEDDTAYTNFKALEFSIDEDGRVTNLATVISDNAYRAADFGGAT